MARLAGNRITEALRDAAQGIPELDTQALETFLATHQAMRRFRAAFSEQFERTRLSPPRFAVLVALQGEEEGLTPAELADELSVARASMTSFLDSLERAGFVTRERHPSDRRMVIIRITPKGRKVIDKSLPTHVRQMAEIFTGLSHAEMKQLQELMLKVARGEVAEGGV